MIFPPTLSRSGEDKSEGEINQGATGFDWKQESGLEHVEFGEGLVKIPKETTAETANYVAA